MYFIVFYSRTPLVFCILGGEARRLVSAASIRATRAPEVSQQALPSAGRARPAWPVEAASWDYALGWTRGTYAGLLRATHGGRAMGVCLTLFSNMARDCSLFYLISQGMARHGCVPHPSLLILQGIALPPI